MWWDAVILSRAKNPKPSIQYNPLALSLEFILSLAEGKGASGQKFAHSPLVISNTVKQSGGGGGEFTLSIAKGHSRPQS